MQQSSDWVLITHNDLDALGAALIFKLLFPEGEVVFTDYQEIDEQFERIIGSFGTKVMIVDICPSEELVRKHKNKADFHILDHHISSQFLEAFSLPQLIWDTSFSGTKLMYEYVKNDLQAYQKGLNGFVEAINAYDMWLKDDIQRENGEKLNSLLDFYGLKDMLKDLLSWNWKKEESLLEYLEHDDKQTVEKVVEKTRDNNKKKATIDGYPMLIKGHNCFVVVKDIRGVIEDIIEDYKYQITFRVGDDSLSIYSDIGIDALDMAEDLASILGDMGYYKDMDYTYGGHTQACGITFKKTKVFYNFLNYIIQNFYGKI